MTLQTEPSVAIDLREAIEAWATRLRTTNPLAQLAFSGGMTARGLAYYLTSLRYLFSHSAKNLARAAQRSADLGMADLAAYFDRKAKEELGHDGWANDDLAKLKGAVSDEFSTAPSVVELVALQEALIEEHPLSFAVYALWAEYFTVLLGDEWLDALASAGFGRDRVSAISKHVEADRNHAARGFDELAALRRGEPSVAALMQVVGRAGSVFERFCVEVYDVARAAA